MKAPVKIHWAKLCILVLLPILVGELSPAHACSPEIDAAILQLQKSAKTETSKDNWLAQIVNKTSSFYNVSDDPEGNDVTGQSSIKQLYAALFNNDKQLLIYLKRYLAGVKIRQNPDENSSGRTFLFNGISYRLWYDYPYSGIRDDGPGSACQLSIGIHVKWPDGFETTYKYSFDIVGGKMKLIENITYG